MKKFLAAIMAIVLVCSIGAASVSAASTFRGRNFVDANNDGICDLYGTNCAFVDEDGDGICDNYNSSSCGGCGYGMGRGHGSRYIDADGDGNCDNFGLYGRGSHGCWNY